MSKEKASILIDLQLSLSEELDKKDFDYFKDNLYGIVKELFLRDNRIESIDYWIASNLVEYGEDHMDFDDAEELGLYDSDNIYFYGKHILESTDKAILLPSGKVIEITF